MLNSASNISFHQHKPLLCKTAIKPENVNVRQESSIVENFQVAKFLNAQKMLSFGIGEDVLLPDFVMSREKLPYYSRNGYKYTVEPPFFVENNGKLNFYVEKELATIPMFSSTLFINFYNKKNLNKYSDYKKRIIISTILYAAIKDAKDINKSQGTRSRNIIIPKLTLDEVKTLPDIVKSITDNFRESKNGLVLKKKDYDSTLEDLTKILGENLEKIGIDTNANNKKASWKRFKSLSPMKFNLSRGDEVFFKDSGIEVSFKKENNKVIVKKQNEKDEVQIIDSSDNPLRRVINFKEHQVINSGDALALGNNIYLFNYNENTGNHELRFLSEDGLRNFVDICTDMLKNKDFKQGNIGDCYFLSAIKALLLKPEGKELIARMLEKKDSTEDRLEVKVRFPGYEQAEFDINEDVLKNEPENYVHGHLYLRILEYAYRQLREDLNWYTIEAFKQKPEKKSSDWLEIGKTSDVFYILTGRESKEFIVKQGENSPAIFRKKMEYLSNNFKNFAITFALTTDKGFTTSSGKVFEKQSHSYTISGIDTKKEEIEIINPHDTSKRTKLSYEDVLNEDCDNFINYVYLGNDAIPDETKAYQL